MGSQDAKTETPSPATPKSANPSSKKPQAPQNTIGLYAVQCGECMKWRLMATEEEYEEVRSKSTSDPFLCTKKPNVTCQDPADIEYDATRTWVIDKPNIPKTPTGFKRKLVLRRDFSKLDAYYLTPTGKKLRSGTEVGKYLNENPDIKGKGVTTDDFSFAVPKVAEDTIPKHIDRKGGDKKSGGVKELKEPKESKELKVPKELKESKELKE